MASLRPTTIFALQSFLKVRRSQHLIAPAPPHFPGPRTHQPWVDFPKHRFRAVAPQYYSKDMLLLFQLYEHPTMTHFEAHNGGSTGHSIDSKLPGPT